MKKLRVFALLLALCLMTALCPSLVPEAKADTVYNAQAAVDYAVAHWDDGVGVCDQFVKACLKAGGITITVGTVDNVRAALLRYGTEYAVTFRNGICYQQYNPNIAVGDIIFYYCSQCGNYPHTAIITKKDDNGIFYFSQHNGAFLNLKFTTGFHDGHGHKDPNISYSVVHIPSSPNAGVEVSFENPLGDITCYSATFYRKWTVTRNGQSISPDDFYFSVYNNSGALMGHVRPNSNGDINTYLSGIILEADTPYSVDSHVIVGGKEYTSQRYSFRTTEQFANFYASLQDYPSYLGDEALVCSEYGARLKLSMGARVEPPKTWTAYGWRLYDNEDVMIYEKTYTPGVDDPADAYIGGEDSGGTMHHGAPGSVKYPFYWSNFVLDLERDVPDCKLKSGRSYYLRGFFILGGQPYFDSRNLTQKNIAFTTLSRTPDVLSSKLTAEAAGKTRGTLSISISGERQDGEDSRSANALQIYVSDENGDVIAIKEIPCNSYLASKLSYAINLSTDTDFGLVLEPGKQYTFLVEALWDDYIYACDPVSFSTEPEPDLILPADLTKIEADAFAGGAFIHPFVPAGVTSIGSGAFANCPNLRYITIANPNTIIDANAFGSSRNIVIHADEGSYAEFFAQKYGFTFIVE